MKKKNCTLSKEEYAKIYCEDYNSLFKKGIRFKFKTIPSGWYKSYYDKDGKYLGYRYSDIIYGRPIIVDTFRKTGYDELMKSLNKFIFYNSIRYIVNGYSPADLSQLQYKIILEKIEKFNPKLGYKIHTFMCKCINNELVNESRRARTLSRAPRINGNKKDFAKFYSIDDEANKYMANKISSPLTDFEKVAKEIDFEKVIKGIENKSIQNIIKKVYYCDYTIHQAAKDEKISASKVSEEIKRLKNNKDLLDFLFEE